MSIVERTLCGPISSSPTSAYAPAISLFTQPKKIRGRLETNTKLHAATWSRTLISDHLESYSNGSFYRKPRAICIIQLLEGRSSLHFLLSSLHKSLESSNLHWGRWLSPGDCSTAGSTACILSWFILLSNSRCIPVRHSVGISIHLPCCVITKICIHTVGSIWMYDCDPDTAAASPLSCFVVTNSSFFNRSAWNMSCTLAVLNSKCCQLHNIDVKKLLHRSQAAHIAKQLLNHKAQLILLRNRVCTSPHLKVTHFGSVCNQRDNLVTESLFLR